MMLIQNAEGQEQAEVFLNENNPDSSLQRETPGAKQTLLLTSGQMHYCYLQQFIYISLPNPEKTIK